MVQVPTQMSRVTSHEITISIEELWHRMIALIT